MYVPHPRIRRLSKIPLVGTAALAALIATSVACFTATPQVAQAADAPAITDMTEQDYQALSSPGSGHERGHSGRYRWPLFH